MRTAVGSLIASNMVPLSSINHTKMSPTAFLMGNGCLSSSSSSAFASPSFQVAHRKHNIVYQRRSILRTTMMAKEDGSATEKVQDEPNKLEIEGSTTVSSNAADESVSSLGPTRKSNRIVAIASVAAAVSLFLVNRGIGSGPSLQELAASALPYEEALRNGKPTVVEFYADWCEICREMARDLYSVEQDYKDQVNFVMLNVDNNKWEAELDEFGVEGIPHFAFLDNKVMKRGML